MTYPKPTTVDTCLRQFALLTRTMHPTVTIGVHDEQGNRIVTDARKAEVVKDYLEKSSLEMKLL